MIARTVLACAGVALLATACTSSGSGSSASASTSGSAAPTTSATSASSTSAPAPATTTVVAPPTASTTPSSSAPSSSAPSSSAPAGPHGCTNAQLSVGHAAPSGATGHGGVVVVFVNESSRTCTLTGYPGAAVLDSSGRQIEQAARTRRGFLGGCGCAPHTVTLRPGGKASALIEGDNGGGDECLRGRALLVTPPNTTRSTRLAFEDYSCDVQVHPTVAGSRGGVT